MQLIAETNPLRAEMSDVLRAAVLGSLCSKLSESSNVCLIDWFDFFVTQITPKFMEKFACKSSQEWGLAIWSQSGSGFRNFGKRSLPFVYLYD